MAPERVVVVGGGISGLAAAWELSGGAEDRARRASTSWCSRRRRCLGGPLRSVDLAGRTVDTGPDGFLGRRPEAVELCCEVGLADALVPIAARGASVWARGRLRPLPDGHALGIPTRFWPTARSGVLGLRGDLGLARDVVLPRPDVRGPIGDRVHRPPRGAQARPAGRRHAGRSPRRRHPRRLGRRHVRRRDLPPAPDGRPAPRRSHAGPAQRGPRTRPRRAAALLVAPGRDGLAGADAGGAAAGPGGGVPSLVPRRTPGTDREQMDGGVRRRSARDGRRRVGHAGAGRRGNSCVPTTTKRPGCCRRSTTPPLWW